MRFGEFVVGEFKGVNPDEGFGAQIRVRVGEPMVRNGDLKPGFEERIEFFQFDPNSGKATLPAGLEVGAVVCVEVEVKGKGYRSADRGVSGMVTRKLKSIVVWKSADGKVAKLDDETDRRLAGEAA